MKNYQKFAVEIWSLYHECSGLISRISGALGRNDSSRLSRQINPNDDRRDNFYVEILEVHREMAREAPEMEKLIWQALERERSVFVTNNAARRKKTAEHINKVFNELGDVIYKNSTGAPKEELVKEAFELVAAGKELYDDIIAEEMPRDEIQSEHFS